MNSSDNSPVDLNTISLGSDSVATMSRLKDVRVTSPDLRADGIGYIAIIIPIHTQLGCRWSGRRGGEVEVRFRVRGGVAHRPAVAVVRVG